MTPFFALLGYHPRMSYEHDIDKRSASESANSNIARYRETLAFLKKELAIAQERQAKSFNKHALERTYNVGDWVYLDRRNIKTNRPNRKLDWKFIGPFQILEKYGKNAYRLDLPTRFKFHDVFHVSLLEKDPSDGEIDQTTIDIDAFVEGQSEYVAEDIVDSQIFEKDEVRDGAPAGLYYLIHWINQPESERTWEHVASVKHLKRLISRFHHRHPEAAASARKPRVGTKRKAVEPAQSEPQPTRIQPGRSGKREKGSWRTEDFV